MWSVCCVLDAIWIERYSSSERNLDYANYLNMTFFSEKKIYLAIKLGRDCLAFCMFKIVYLKKKHNLYLLFFLNIFNLAEEFAFKYNTQCITIYWNLLTWKWFVYFVLLFSLLLLCVNEDSSMSNEKKQKRQLIFFFSNEMKLQNLMKVMQEVLNYLKLKLMTSWSRN